MKKELPYKDHWSKKYNRYIRLNQSDIYEHKQIYKLGEDLFYIKNKDLLLDKRQIEIHLNTIRQYGKSYFKYRLSLNI